MNKAVDLMPRKVHCACVGDEIKEQIETAISWMVKTPVANMPHGPAVASGILESKEQDLWVD